MDKVKRYKILYNKVMLKNYNLYGEIILKIKKEKVIFLNIKNNKYNKVCNKLIRNSKKV